LLAGYRPFAQVTPFSMSLPEQKYFDPSQEAVHDDVVTPSL
jgi:hypothetical protein